MLKLSGFLKLVSILTIWLIFRVRGKPAVPDNSENFRVNNSRTKKSMIPAIYSGPLPECPPIPWDNVDPCHKHKCKKSIHFVVSKCTTMGVTCGQGEYLKISPNAKSFSECCKCTKFEG